MTTAHGWRPIAEAPRDGTPVLARDQNGRCAVVVWHDIRLNPWRVQYTGHAFVFPTH